MRPKVLNSSWIGSVPQRRGTETRLFGGERGIIRACGPHPFGAAVAALRRSFAPAVLKSNHRALTKASYHLINKKAPDGALLFIGGERGIRTLDTLPYTHFPGVLLQPLGHLSRFLTSANLYTSVFPHMRSPRACSLFDCFAVSPLRGRRRYAPTFFRLRLKSTTRTPLQISNFS